MDQQNLKLRRSETFFTQEETKKIESIFYPRCECGAFLKFTTNKYIHFRNEDYNFYRCTKCGTWIVRIVEKKHG